jgi:hypothetical protein
LNLSSRGTVAPRSEQSSPVATVFLRVTPSENKEEGKRTHLQSNVTLFKMTSFVPFLKFPRNRTINFRGKSMEVSNRFMIIKAPGV